MKRICKKACKTVGTLYFTSGKLSCSQELKEEIKEARDIFFFPLLSQDNGKVDQAFMKYVKCSLTFHERSNTVVVTSGGPNARVHRCIVIFFFFQYRIY